MTGKTTRKIIAIRGDIQSGHAGGLCNPETEIPVLEINDEGDRVVTGFMHPELTPTQRRLWKWHAEDLANVRSLAGKDEIVFVEMGDLTQGNVFKDDLKETSLSAQYFISKASMFPWLELPNLKNAYITKGTGVHVWGEGSTETMLTFHLKDMYPKKNITVTDHYLLDVDGFRLDIAHHGAGPGIRNWTRGNVLRLYCESILADDLEFGVPVPNVVLRAHWHEFTYAHAVHQVAGRIYELPGFIVPPYCFIGSHAQKTIKSPSRMSVGVLALEIVNGKLLDKHPFIHTVDLRVSEVLK